MNIEYPRIAFAFNPIIVKCTDVSGECTLVLSGIELKRYPINGVVEFNISQIAQSKFNRNEFNIIDENDVTLKQRVLFSISDEEDNNLAYIDVIWGALDIGQKYIRSKKLTWYKNLPFTFPLFLKEARDFLIQIDRNNPVNWKNISAGKKNIKINVHANNRISIWVNNGDYNEDFNDDYNWWDSRTIDDEQMIEITLKVNECTEGYYLRWINKFGEWCYFLFQGKESVKIDNELSITNFFNTVEFENGYHAGTNRFQSKNVQNTVKLNAPLIDEDEYKHLLSLPQSVHVDLFCGYENGQEQWKGVNIDKGTFTENEKHLQDFECTMILPTSFNQSL